MADNGRYNSDRRRRNQKNKTHTDWTRCYMGFGQDRGERRTGLTSHPERQSQSARCFSKNPEIGFHNHIDARSCQWMVVIMDYDIADHGR
jgi:hypothetical protein